MVSTILVVAFAATVFEIIIASKWTWYRLLAGNNTLVNFAGSMALSYVLSAAWDMTGMIAGTAAMLSTLFTIPYYKGMAWWDAQGDEVKASIAAFRANWGKLFKDMIRVIEITFRIIIFPITLYRWVQKSLVTIKDLGRSSHA
jgi:hypothetical protein